MRKSRFTDEKMVRIIREADKAPVADVAKKHGVSDQTIYLWRRRFGTMGVDDAKRLKSLEQENAKLKKLLVDRMLDIEVLKDINAKKMVSVPGRRLQVAHAHKRWKLPLRRACTLLSVARSSARYASKREVSDAPVVKRMRELAAQYPRYGYRRIRIFLGRDGHHMSVDRAHRLWRTSRLQVPRKRPRRRLALNRPRPTPPTSRNHVWAYDFVFDACADGKQLKCLTIVDEWTRECLAIDVAGSIRSSRVIDVLARLVSIHGASAFMRSDNGPEFVSNAILKWIVAEGIGSALSDPGKPWQNGTDESFNGKFRDECLSMEYFRSRPEAIVTIETWRKHYNDVRPHSSLDYRTPNEFKRDCRNSVRETREATSK